jgi:hypothetical protein
VQAEEFQNVPALQTETVAARDERRTKIEKIAENNSARDEDEGSRV